ncbi:MAG: Na(+)-translocating NADH-quinone reductase subunit A [Candidatus Amulumruptor caecigallinarius]|nr:Na(+)-translocating NADH-quinone reductase subunit A [Candidatus Amulumruptor caecigallinarius]
MGARIIKIKKGLNIPISGRVEDMTARKVDAERCAIIPDDFPGYTWKAAVKAGESVLAGAPLLFAKEDESLCLTSPVAGIVEDIHRGERRKIEYVSVKKTGEQNQHEFPGNEGLLTMLKRSGLYAMMRQRPFDTVPFVNIKPRDIFITAFDTAPLAIDMVSDNVKRYLEAGIKALKSLTDGNVYLSVAAGSGLTSDIAVVNEFEGPHPAGNVGTQIAAISPVNKGETVWTLDVVTAARIGEFSTEGKLNYNTNVAVTGPSVKKPYVAATTIGAALKPLIGNDINRESADMRYISGNVLTGVKVDPETGFLHYPYKQVTVIPEGNHADEFMGWASLDPGKFSVKRTFPAFLRGLAKPYGFDARIKGGHRAMILSGEYDKVFPMDIYPEFLLKAIMAKDIEKMEQLGIYEVAPEDFALAEFVDTSKIELQKIVKEGLDYLRKETL